MSDLLQNLNAPSEKVTKQALNDLRRKSRFIERATLRANIHGCHKDNPHWNYSRIARQVGCSHTTVRRVLNEKSAPKVVKVRKEKRVKRTIDRKARPVVEPTCFKRKFRQDAERKLEWYLRKLIRNTIPCYRRQRYLPKRFDACTYITLIRSALEAQFTEGMNWRTLGKVWMIELRVDSFHFNLDELLQQRMAFHWSNLVPVKIGKKVKNMDDVKVQIELNRLYNQVRNEDYYRGNKNTHEFEEWEKSRFPINRPQWGQRGEVPDYLTFLGPNKKMEEERTKSLSRIRRRERLAKEKESLESSKLVESATPFEQALTTQPTRVALLS